MIRRWIVRHPLVTFFTLAYALSWCDWLWLAFSGARVGLGSRTTHFPGLLAPAVAAFVVAAACGEARVLAMKLVRMKAPRLRSLLLAASPVGIFLVAQAVALSLGRPLPSLAAFRLYPGLPELPVLAVVVFAITVNGCGEEIGWRGFALPRLQARLGPLRGVLVLALLWAGWHGPLFFINESMRGMGPGMVLGWLVGLTSGSIVLAFVTARTGGSVLAAAIWHGLYNMTSATAAAHGLVAAIATALVMLWAVVLLRMERKRQTQDSLLCAAPSGPVRTGADMKQAGRAYGG